MKRELLDDLVLHGQYSNEKIIGLSKQKHDKINVVIQQRLDRVEELKKLATEKAKTAPSKDSEAWFWQLCYSELTELVRKWLLDNYKHEQDHHNQELAKEQLLFQPFN